MIVWRIAADTPGYESDDMNGAGAKSTGGRWNSKGTALIYSATSRALACLETLVHFNAAVLPLNRYLIQIDIPDDVWAARTVIDLSTAPIGWDALPAGRASMELGNTWIRDKTSAILLVPSIAVPEEQNILINPAHPQSVQIKAIKIRKWIYDSRLVKR
jgi:RES domain-containing protein